MKVLVLGSGGAAANGFARALRLAGGYQLVGTNSSETDLLLSECDTNYLISHVRDERAWRDAVLRIVRDENPVFVHAQSDPEVAALGRLRPRLHILGAKTWLPSGETIHACQDKWTSYRVWRAAGITVPETQLACSRDLISSIIGLGPHTEAWMRPRTGAGGQKSIVVTSYKEAVWWLDRHHGWDKFTIAEVLPGSSVTVQQLYWHGRLVASVQRKRESWANSAATLTGVSGSTGVGVISKDREPDRVADLAVRAIDRAPHGLYGIDMTYNKYGTPCPTEINIGRFFTTAPEFFAMAGFNMADHYVRQGENAYFMHDHGQPVVPVRVPRNPIPAGKRWIRGMDHLPVLA